MRTTMKRFAVVAAFVVLLLIAVVNGMITRRQLANQLDKRALMTHSRDVMMEVAQTESLLKDAETGQRGYLYTGDSRYLGPYNSALNQLRGHVQRLSQLVSEDPKQQERFIVLESLIDSKLGELARTVTLVQAGQADEAKELVLTNVGRQTMDQIRGVAAEMWSAEAALDEERTDAYKLSARQTIWTIYLATLSTLFSVGAVAYLVMREIKTRERFSQEIQQREEWFRVTLNSIGDGVIATDPRGNVTFMNQVAETIIGMKAWVGKGQPVTNVFPIFNENTNEPVENPVAKVISAGVTVGLANHTILVRADGGRVPIEDSAAPIRNDKNEIVGVVLVFRDATHERKSQQMLRRAEKLAAAGRLAATMAHEINNPLEAVANLLFIVKGSPELSQESKDHLTLAEQQLDRVSHITRQTLGFYREPVNPGIVNIPGLVDSVLSLYDNKMRSKNIKVESDVETVTSVSGMSGELRQLIANLVSNAVDALPTNGKLNISARPADWDGVSGVELRVADNGPGVSSEHVEQIFEPFFTTKADVGTGLGLWVAREIAERHGGYLRLEKPPNPGGAVFSVFLPSNGASSEAASA